MLIIIRMQILIIIHMNIDIIICLNIFIIIRLNTLLIIVISSIPKRVDVKKHKHKHLHPKEGAQEVDVNHNLDQLGVNQGDAHLTISN